MADEQSNEIESAIVIDNGSGYIKAGFAGNNLPNIAFPSVVGRPRHKGVMVGMRQHDVYVGDEAQAKRGILSLKYPIENGITHNWDDLEKIWHHTFYEELRVAPEEHTVLLTQITGTPKVNTEKSIQIMFETFDIPAYSVADTAILTLYASGLTTGVAVESGYSVTQIVPCYEGVSLYSKTCRLDIGGAHVSKYLIQILNERLAKKGHCQFGMTSCEKEIIDDIKIKHAFVALDYESAMKCDDIEFEQQYELPDGQILVFNKETFQCPEILFDPMLIGLEQNGIHKLIFECVEKCDEDMQKDLFENIVFGGGNTMFKGMENRLIMELKKLTNSDELVNGYVRKYLENNKRRLLGKDIINLMIKYSSMQHIHPSENRQYSTWIGGSVLASLSTFDSLCIGRNEYEENGPSIVHKKCFLSDI
eukprot:283479_1